MLYELFGTSSFASMSSSGATSTVAGELSATAAGSAASLEPTPEAAIFLGVFFFEIGFRNLQGHRTEDNTLCNAQG